MDAISMKGSIRFILDGRMRDAELNVSVVRIGGRQRSFSVYVFYGGVEYKKDFTAPSADSALSQLHIAQRVIEGAARNWDGPWRLAPRHEVILSLI